MDVQQPTASCAHHRGHSSKTAEQRKLIPAPFTWLGEVAGPRRALNASMSRSRRPEYANSDRISAKYYFRRRFNTHKALSSSRYQSGRLRPRRDGGGGEALALRDAQ